MKIPKKLASHICIVAFLIGFLSACTLNMADGSDTITKEDLQAATRILGESLSSDHSGVMLSLTDALTNISSSSFTPSAAQKSGSFIYNDRSGRGNEMNYQYSYHPEAGIHTISFQRQVEGVLFKKDVTDTLNYIFRDSYGNFIELPGQESDRIESIVYNGRREGEISTLKQESFFVRKDTFLIDGVSDASSTLTIDGVHNGEGVIVVEHPDKGAVERSYELEINFLNIRIEKLSTGSIDIHRGVTGTLSWKMLIKKNAGNHTDSKEMHGTIELSGDGTALLHFENFLKLFQVNVDDGGIKDLDHEFEGGVQSVNFNDESVTLVNGQIVYLTNDTEFDSDEYPTLKSMQEAYNSGISIWTEGEGFVQNGQFKVSEIEFENESEEEDNGDNEEEIDFEEQLTAIDVEAGTLTLGNQVAVEVNDQTTIENSSDYQSLQEVSDALDQGISIYAIGEVMQADGSSGADLVAISVDFDKEDNGDEED